MTGVVIPKTFRKVDTWGNPHHGLSINGLLTLSNGSTVSSSIDASKRRFGDCHAIQVPGHTFTDTQPLGTHLKFEEYALSSGFEKRNLYNYRINHGDKRQFIYCDTNKDRWKINVNQNIGGTSTSTQLTITATKFGDFTETGPATTYINYVTCGNAQLPAGNPLGDYRTEVVNVSKNGNLVVIGLSYESSAMASGSYNIHDRAYAYPVVFIRLDITAANTMTGSIYSDTPNTTKSVINVYVQDFVASYKKSAACYSLKKTQLPNTANGNVHIATYIDTFVTYSNCSNINGVVTTGAVLPAAPANTSLYTYVWEYTYYTVLFSMSLGRTYSDAPLFSGIDRLIHVFIDDSNTLVPVVVEYRTGKNRYTETTLTGFTDNRTYNYNTTVRTGEATAVLSKSYMYATDKFFNLRIGGSIVDSCTVSTQSSVGTPYVRTVSGNPPTYTTVTSTMPSGVFFNGTLVNTGSTATYKFDGYSSALGHLFDGYYNSQYPFVQVFTNNLVGMCLGGMDMTHATAGKLTWNTSTTGNIQVRSIYSYSGLVYSGGTIPAMTRYCSYHPINHTFSGLYDVPVCYV